jgi:hypothetical protein
VRPEYRKSDAPQFSHKYSWLHFQKEAKKIQPGKAKFSHKYAFAVENSDVFSQSLATGK